MPKEPEPIKAKSYTPTEMRLHDIWALDYIHSIEKDYTKAVEKRPYMEIHVQDQKIYGNTGCNQFSGKAIIENDSLNFSQMIATRMYCEGVEEQPFLEGLRTANRYVLKELKLHLYQDDKEVLRFRKVD